MQLFAVLGSHPSLSLAEWRGVAHAVPVFSTEKIAVFNDISGFSPNSLQHQLGGTQRIGTIIGSFARGHAEEIAEFLSSTLIQEAESGKIPFGISVFAPEETLSQWKQKEQQIGMTVKRLLKEQGFSARYVTSKLDHLSSVVIRKNQLIERGAEFVLIEREKEILVGITTAAQDVDDWSKRDYGRPARDAKRGMLPPKLARMMLNISGSVDAKTVLDPFCGSGTVLMEALFLGAKKVFGTDISHAAIEDTRKNILWLEQAYEFPAPEMFLTQTTAANIATVIKEESIDTVVTEPFLGKPRTGKESAAQVEEAVEELNTLYRQSFAAIHKVMKVGGVLVVASPVHIVREEAFPVATRQILKEIGFKETKLSQMPLLYRHKGQFVGREIMRFQK